MDTLIFGEKEVFTTPLRRIEHPKGDIYHAMKCSDPGYAGFGEAYFSSAARGAIKGWKQHTRMQMNLIVPLGLVQFYIHCEKERTTKSVIIGSDNYQRLTVSPGYWMAFKGIGESLNLVLNVASIEHDPTEAINSDLNTFPLEA